MKIINVLLISIAIFLLSIFSFPSSLCAKEGGKFYHINLFYEQGKLELKNIEVFQGYIAQPPQEGDYRIELISLSGTALYTDHFQIPLSIHGEQIDARTGKSIPTSQNVESTDISLGIPHFSEGKVINIYDLQNKIILTIPVAHFAEITPSPIPPTPPIKVTKLEKGIGAPWIIGGGILIFIISAIGVFVYSRFKKPQNLLQ